jgi:hypothetical protein
VTAAPALSQQAGGHTPTPWVAEGPDMFGDYNIVRGDSAEALAVAAVVSNMRPAEEVAANAALIVRAVNSHEIMRAALKRAEQFIVNGVELGVIRMPDADCPDPAHETLPAIRAALQQSEAE